MTETYLVHFEVGDWSGDGHSQTDKYLYRSNVSPEALKAAMKQTCDDYGIEYAIHYHGFPKIKYCEDYEDNTFPGEILNLLGFDCETFDNELDLEGDASLGPDDFSKIIVHMIKLADPTIELEPVETAWLPVGGYGLFY